MTKQWKHHHQKEWLMIEVEQEKELKGRIIW